MGLFKVHPCGKQYRITQGWGENPGSYSKFSCGSVALRGHNGIDFGTPVGTPIVAVDAGTVLETASDPAGYGLYVKIKHGWGESLYAHLSTFAVAAGQAVTAGARLGLSGNTGNSTGPHLHFAIRISPYYRNDGWCGFSDPTYHLQALDKKPLAYLSVQFLRQGLGAYLPDLARLQPSSVVLLDPNPSDAQAIRDACPNTMIVGRIYRPDSEISDRIKANPKDAGKWMHQISMENRAVVRGLIDFVQVPNEVCQFWDELEALRDAELERMRQAELSQLFKCAVLGTSVGNLHMPENDRMAYWRVVYPVLERAENNGHLVLIHQYGAPDMWGPKNMYGPDASQWLAERWQYQVYPRLPFRRKLKVLVGEFGIDGLLMQGQPAGWQKYTTAEGYARQLIDMADHHERWRGQVIGATVFAAAINPPWETYDITGEVLRRLADHYQAGGVPTPQPPPSPPAPPPLPPQGDGSMEVFDKNGVQRDMGWLRLKYGNVQFLDAGTGKKFRLVRVDETEGPAVIKVRVLNEQGLPQSGQPVANHWPDPALPDLRNAGLKTLWRDRAAHQNTDGAGFTGFGLGTGSYIRDLQEGGPHVVWVLSPSFPSDGLSGIGMLGGTNHAGPLFLTFQIGETLPPATNLNELLIRTGNQKQVIQFNPDAALQKRIFADGFVPNSPEFTVNWVGQTYVGQRAENLKSGEVRVYYCKQGDWGNVLYT